MSAQVGYGGYVCQGRLVDGGTVYVDAEGKRHWMPYGKTAKVKRVIDIDLAVRQRRLEADYQEAQAFLEAEARRRVTEERGA